MLSGTMPLRLPRPVAFALSGGTSLGAIQVGMLRALHERGVVPDLLVGSSVGAINAAFAAGGYGEGRIDALASLWTQVRAADVFGRPGMQRYVGLLRGRGALVSSESLRTLLARHLPARHSDLEIRTAVIATDLLSGDPVVLDDGDLRENLLASAAIPGVFPPVKRAGRVLGDGGIAAHVPVLEAAELGAQSVVVLDTGYPCTLTQLPQGVVPNVVHLLNLMFRHQAVAALSLLGARCPVLYLPSPCPLGVAPHDFTRARTLIAGGYAATSRYLARIRVHGPGVYGHPHFHASGGCDDAAATVPGLATAPSGDRDLVTSS
jgi:NTE family protein